MPGSPFVGSSDLLRRSKGLDWKTIAHIKAQIIENCPVPNILDTEYFDGMKPTIMSLGRKPGRAQDDDGMEPEVHPFE